jgi:hypothetical protein
MSWLDDIFGGSSAPAPQGPAPLPPAANPDPRVTPSYGDFYNSLLRAKQAQGYWGNIGQHGLLGAIGQTDRDLASLPVAAPDAYLKLLTAQQGAQAGGLENQGKNADLAQTLEVLRRSGVNVPDLMNGQGGASGAPQSGVVPAGAPTPPPVGQRAPAPPSASPLLPPTQPPMSAPASSPASTPPVPAGGAPSPIPALPGAPTGPVGAGTFASTGNPLDAQRQRLTQYANLYAGLPKYTPAAQEYFKIAQMGAVPGTAVRPDTGQLVDVASGAPVGDLRKFEAGGAGMKAGAEAAAQVGPHNAETAFKGKTEQETNRLKIEGEAGNAPVTGFDKTTGQPATTTKLAVAQGKAPNFIEGANPYFAGQQEELKTLRTDASDADQGLQLALQVQNAANGIYTGKGAAELQDLRKLAQAAAGLTGQKVPAEIDNNTSKFEQLKFASQQLVAKASHMLSPRIAQNIYQQINNVKPGDATSMQGLRDIITNEIVPALGRQKAMFGATAGYYQKNPTRNDAAAVIPGQLNLGDFHVKSDLHSVKPGDFYMDPASGNLRQRPAQ